MLTSSHLTLVKLALESRNYNHAVPVLEKYILYFPGTKDQPKPKYICDMSLSPSAYITPETKLTSKLKYQDLLEYFYYSGMAFIALKRWEAALQCLENAVTFPAKDNVVSKIMVEAYKKWILVGILVEGKLLPLPKSTSSGAAKSYHILAKPHETFAQIFENGTASRLKAEADAGQIFWSPECNAGLVQQVLAAYQRFQIRNLANIYSKISIQEIIKETTSAETGAKLPSVAVGEELVRDMITRGELHATLGTSPTGQSILAFSPSGQVLTELDMKKQLAASIHRIKTLTQEIKTTDRLLTHDKEYIKHAQKIKKSTGDGAVDLGISQDFYDPVEDEDIMSMQ
jgi:COP9 signalosome complex subunit 3